MISDNELLRISEMLRDVLKNQNINNDELVNEAVSVCGAVCKSSGAITFEDCQRNPRLLATLMTVYQLGKIAGEQGVGMPVSIPGGN